MSSPGPNAQQVSAWNEAQGRTWADLYPILDRQLGPATHLAIDALAPTEGERILDVGCGAGRSSIDLASRVGVRGRVHGVDVSQPLLRVARERAEGLTNVTFEEADASVATFEPASFDALFSAFGVMFFADPVAAFTKLRRALVPDARMAFVCWRDASENPVMTLPLEVTRHRLPPLPPPVPDAPGPFAFANGERIHSILGGAGFQDVTLTPHHGEMGGNTPDDALTLALRVGPLASVLREHPHLADAVRGDLRAGFARFERDGAVWLPAALWIVTARA